MAFVADDRELIEHLLAQNDVLIAALIANQPVEVIRAMNPPVIQPLQPEPWGTDMPSQGEKTDVWGDAEVPNEELLAMGTGWVGGEEPEEEPADAE